MIVVYGATFTVIAVIDDVGEAYAIAYFESSVFRCRMDLLDMAGTFMTDGYGFFVSHGHGHKVGVAQGRRCQFDEELPGAWCRLGDFIDYHLLLCLT